MSKDKIEVNMNVYDIPILVEALEEANKEIERLNKDNDDLQNRFNSLMEAHKICDEENERLTNELDREKIKVKEYGTRLLKAIEYIHNNYPVCAGKELLEILQDDNKQRKGEIVSLEELESYEPKNIEEQEYFDNFWN